MSRLVVKTPENVTVKRGGIAMVLVGALALSGCVGGTTYGTGVTHEQQTLEAVSNMFTFSNADPQTNIDYSARPDLVMPADKGALPEPLDESVTTSNPDWPESPEQRLARLRAAADANDDQFNQAVTDDQGNPLIGRNSRNETQQYQYDLDRGDNGMIYEQDREARKRFKQAKERASYSRGPSRKYLTEPPVDYRRKTTDIAEDDLGLTPEQIAERERIAEEEKRDLLRSGGRSG